MYIVPLKVQWLNCRTVAEYSAIKPRTLTPVKN